MPVPATNDEFLDLIRKSGVVEEAKLKAYLEKIRTAPNVPEHPGKFASWLVRDGILTYFQAEQILQGKYKRFSIGKYKVLEKLGAGGMGQVFLCEHKMMRRRVAVKVLPIASARDDAARERFYREARAVAALDHPNIVRAYDVDQDDDLHFLVMEFVDGTNLHDLIKKHGPLAVDRACHYMYAAAAGLDYANSVGIVHRDIKPGNLLVERAGIVKVLDMGLARFFQEEDESLTRKYDENVLGTADYLAPEQAIDSHRVDCRADIYSLGGTFYYLLTGSAPFPDGSIAQKLLFHQTREPKSIHLIRPEVPDGVVAIVEKMMKKLPEERYATPAELMADLAVWVQTPIAPPSAAEMPKLSRAASAGASSMAGRAQASGVLLAGASSSGGLPVIPYSTGGMGSQTSAVIAGSPPPIWEDIATSETVPPGPAVTPQVPPKPAPARSSRAKPGESAPETKKRNYALLAIVAGTLILLGSVTAYLLSGKKKTPVASTSTAPAAAGPRTLYVTKGASTSPDSTFTTLAAALKRVNPGDTILLVDDPHEEPPVRIVATSVGKLKDVVIEAGNPSKSVRMRLPEGSLPSTKHGVIELTGTDGLTLRNLTLDAGGRVDCALMIEGQVDGLKLENLALRGAVDAGIKVSRIVASPDRPARFERLAFHVDKPNCDGLQLLGDAGKSVANLKVTDCRFHGRGWNAVHFRGQARDVELVNNRIFNFENGIYLEGPDNSCQIRVVNNTFHTIEKFGLILGSSPPTNPPPEVILERNYFAKTGSILKGIGSRFPGLKPANNARDAASRINSLKEPSKDLDPKAAEIKNYTLPAPTGDDPNFLLIADDSPLKKQKIGAQ